MTSSLKGLEIGGFRSFSSPQIVDFSSSLTLLAGVNNSGKSNAIRALERFVPAAAGMLGRRKPNFPWDDLDEPRHLKAGVPLQIGFVLDGVSGEDLGSAIKDRPEARTLIDVTDRLREAAPNDCLLFQFHLSASGDGWSVSWSKLLLDRLVDLDQNAVNRLCSALLSRNFGDHRRNVEALLDHISRGLTLTVPDVVVVPALRRVEDGSDEGWSGRGIIDRLAALQNPGLHTYQRDRDRFQQLNQLLRTVTQDDDARLEIPNDQSMMLVHLDDRLLPLDSLGTGIHQVILIGAAATVERGALLCLEEPEANMHPILQRQLVDYLSRDEENKYVISTHSAHILDAGESRVLRVRLEQGSTELEESMDPGARWQVCRDLGYRASDLIQANYVIWVEGPSDRIYVNDWITRSDPRLHEGVHYSVMFYGGRLLARVSVQDEPTEDFTAILPINRNLAVLIDSDKKSGTASLNATKRRVIKEVRSAGGFAWVTKGREIENYIAKEPLRAAIRSLGFEPPSRMGQYDRVYPNESSLSKIELAREAARSKAGMRLDCEAKVSELTMAIAESNGLPIVGDGLA